MRTRSDQQGEFELALSSSGLARVAVEQDGFEPHARRLLVFLGQDLELGPIVLEPGVFLAGRVLDDLGAPLPGAELWQERVDEGLTFGPAGADAARAELVARTDASGRFELARVAAGPWSLEARAGEHAPAWARGETGFPGERVAGVELVLGPGAAIEGRVVGLAAEELANATVIARPARGGERTRGPRTPLAGDPVRATLDERGGFRLGGLAAGEERELLVLVEGGERRPRAASEPLLARAGEGPVELHSRAPDPREPELARMRERARDSAPEPPGSAAVEVLVRRPDGSPAAGALVALRGGEALGDRPRRPGAIRATDAGGLVRWDGLAPGRHELCVVAGVFGLGEDEVDGAWSPVELAADQEATLELTSEARAALTGRVRVLGAPLANAQVLVRPAPAEARRGGLALTTRSDAEGRFAFRDLPLGSYRVELLHPARAVPARETVVLGPEGAELALELDDQRLAGLVRDGEGRPIAGAVVSVLRDEGAEPGTAGGPRRPPGAGRVLTDGSGRFELGGLEPGVALELEVSAPGRATLRTGRIMPGAPREIELAPEARLAVELVADGRPFFLLVARDAAGSSRAFELVTGRATGLSGLAPGAWRLELYPRASRGERESAPLDVREVELDQERPTELRWVVP